MEGTRAALALIVVLAGGAAASTSCNQKFTFLGLTRGSHHTVWVAEELGGECLSAQLVQVILDEPDTVTVTTDIPSRQTGWLKEAMGNFAVEKAQPMKDNQGLWMAPATTWSVAPPQPRDDLAKAFTDHVVAGGSNGSTWNKARGLKGVVPPQIGNADAKLIYFDPSGLYFDYTISQAFWMPRSGYLVVFTKQKLLAVGLDTMHGFMVLKVSQ